MREYRAIKDRQKEARPTRRSMARPGALSIHEAVGSHRRKKLRTYSLHAFALLQWAHLGRDDQDITKFSANA